MLLSVECQLDLKSTHDAMFSYYLMNIMSEPRIQPGTLLKVLTSTARASTWNQESIQTSYCPLESGRFL